MWGLADAYDELYIGGQSTFDVDLFVPKPRRLTGTPKRGGIGFCRSCFSCEAFFWLRTINLVDELHIGGQSTFDVDLFVPKPRRLPGTPKRGGIGFCRSCFSCEAFFWLRKINHR